MPTGKQYAGVDLDAVNAAVKTKLRQMVEGGGGVGTTSAGPTIRPPTTYEKYVQPVADPILDTLRKVAGFAVGETPAEQAMNSILAIAAPVRVGPERETTRVARNVVANRFLLGNKRKALSASNLDTRGLKGEQLDKWVEKGNANYDRLVAETDPTYFNPGSIRRQLEIGEPNKGWYDNTLAGSREYLGTNADDKWFAINAATSAQENPAGETGKSLFPVIGNILGLSPQEAAKYSGFQTVQDKIVRILGGDLSNLGGRKQTGYAPALGGNPNAMAGDQHIGRGWGMHVFDPAAELQNKQGKPLTGGWVRYSDSAQANAGASLKGHAKQQVGDMMPLEYDIFEDVLPVIGAEYGMTPRQAQAAQWFGSKTDQRGILTKLAEAGKVDPSVVQGNLTTWTDAPIEQHLARRWKAWELPKTDPNAPLPKWIAQKAWDEMMFDKIVRGPNWKSVAAGRPHKDLYRTYDTKYDF